MQGKREQMEEQMSLFDVGGLADDGAMRDPVSGNEVPPGSMASEVRDDVPAMLSEGEYIVPADVVRYYGVKFFEDLRMGAKSGMRDMEQDGRIGGEPVGAATEDDLTPEEMQMLAEITGMYGGGMVRRGYQEGGDVANVNPPFVAPPNYNIPGFSLFQPLQPTAAQTPVQAQSVTLYGANGEIVSLTLPADQERYNTLLGQGYSTEPRVQTAPPSQQEDDRDEGEDMGATTSGGGRLNDEVFSALQSDPLGYGMDLLGRGDLSRVGAGVGSVVPGVGPLVGGLAGGAITANNVARARAASQIAESQGLDTTELDTAIDDYIRGLPNISRVLSNVFATGDNIAQRYFNQLEETATAVTPTVAPVTSTTTAARRSTTVSDRDTLSPLAPTTSVAPPQRPDRDRDDSMSASISEAQKSRSKDVQEGKAPAAGRTDVGRDIESEKYSGKGYTSGRATGGLVAKPSRKKPVAKKK